MRYFWIRSLIISFSVITLTTLPATSAEERVSISNGDYAVPGVLSLPALMESPAPAVLMLHGTASQKHEVGDLYRLLAERLARVDIASLRIDFAGAGESTVDHGLFSLSGATRDAQSAYDFLASHPRIDRSQLVVLGFSQGGLIAQRLALQEPGLLALATWSTAAANGRGSFADFFEKHHGAAKDTGYATVEFPWLPTPLRFSAQWFEEIDSHQTLDEMTRFRRPILAVAGTADRTVPYQQSLALIGTSSHPMSQLVLLARANHIFNVLTPAQSWDESRVTSYERLLRISVNWLSELFHQASDEESS